MTEEIIEKGRITIELDYYPEEATLEDIKHSIDHYLSKGWVTGVGLFKIKAVTVIPEEDRCLTKGQT